MSKARENFLSLTHTSTDKLTKAQIANEVEAIKTRILKQFETELEKRKSLLETLDELTEFELGRFAIKNKGALSGYWTWYIILGFNKQQITSPLEKFLLERSPIVLATRERFNIFQELLIKNIKSNSVVCSIPCGMMADLLTLELPENVKEVRFVGIDLDETVIGLAKELKQQCKSPHQCDFFQQDAWNLEFKDKFDIITSNGLNIYEKEDSRVVALYRAMFSALKAGGKLICSALTCPPAENQKSEWDFEKINMDDLKLTQMLFKSILEATWSNFRSSEKTLQQLKDAGFENVVIHWDAGKTFPTFCAQKPSNSLADIHPMR
jgi:SAM-dependent methyltransferase